MKKYISILSLAILLPLGVLAHGTGVSYEQEVDGYKVDIGRSVDKAEVGELVTFDFSLYKDSVLFDNYSDVWVRIVRDEKTLFASGIHRMEFGASNLSYSFLEDGDYTIHARYENDSESLAEVSFPINVINTKEAAEYDFEWLLYLGLGGVLGFGVRFLIK